MTETKLYNVRGKVQKVYDAREVTCQFGPKKVIKSVTDVKLQLDAGAVIKLCLWDCEIPFKAGDYITASNVAFKGKYNNEPQYSGTKTTQLTFNKKSQEVAAEEPEAEATDSQPEGVESVEEPKFAEPEEVTGDGAPEEVAEEAPKPVAKKATTRAKAIAKAATPAPSTAVSGYTVNAKATAKVTAIATAALKIVGEIAPEDIKKDPQAIQSFFATIFINLSTQDYHESVK